MFRYVTSVVADGDMLSRENRAKWYAKQGLDEKEVALMSVGSKGSEVVWIDEQSGGTVVEADALLTKTSGIALGLLTADCVPVIFHEPRIGIVGLAHCGWSGTHQKLAARVVERVVRSGGTADAIVVYIGPSIHKELYLVQAEKLSQRDDPAWQPFLSEGADGMWQVDVAGYVRAQLIQAGVVPEHITESTIDTFSDTNYFSHRRAVQTSEADGRFLTLVWGMDGQDTA